MSPFRYLSDSVRERFERTANGRAACVRNVRPAARGALSSCSQPLSLAPLVTLQPWEPSYPWYRALRAHWSIRVSFNALLADRRERMRSARVTGML